MYNDAHPLYNESIILEKIVLKSSSIYILASYIVNIHSYQTVAITIFMQRIWCPWHKASRSYNIYK